jgi:hypothetical protein
MMHYRILIVILGIQLQTMEAEDSILKMLVVFDKLLRKHLLDMVGEM